MRAASAPRMQRVSLPFLAPSVAALVCALAAAGAAVVIAIMGLWSLLLPVYSAALVAAFAYPKHTAATLLALGIVFEPNASDITEPISSAIYSMPPGWEHAFDLTISPIEVAIIAVAVSLFLRRGQAARRLRLPLVALAVPVAIGLGLVYGFMRGGPTNLAYTESRGLLAGFALFYIGARLGPDHLPTMARTVVLGVLGLSTLSLIRYFGVRSGDSSVPIEFVFAHESALIMGVGLLLGGAQLLRAKDLKGRLLMVGYCAVVFAAMLATGRRAATLVVLIGVLSMGLSLLPRRPILVLSLGGILAIGFTAYLAAYWNQEYGALAQPARAVRSQFDPTVRDESSDSYRQIEKSDVIETIRLNRVFGVGFGRPFVQFQLLPDLKSFWPLQSYTPHQGILWLWLKMGWLGISVFLGFVMLVLQRCRDRMALLRHMPIDSLEWMAAAVAFSVVLMFIVYSTVDLGFASTRSLAPAAIAAGIVLAWPAVRGASK